MQRCSVVEARGAGSGGSEANARSVGSDRGAPFGWASEGLCSKSASLSRVAHLIQTSSSGTEEGTAGPFRRSYEASPSVY